MEGNGKVDALGKNSFTLDFMGPEPTFRLKNFGLQFWKTKENETTLFRMSKSK